MKSLFDENFKYTPEAEKLDANTHNSLIYLFEQYVKNGYSPREVHYIMTAALKEMELESILEMNSNTDLP